MKAQGPRMSPLTFRNYFTTQFCIHQMINMLAVKVSYLFSHNQSLNFSIQDQYADFTHEGELLWNVSAQYVLGEEGKDLRTMTLGLDADNRYVSPGLSIKNQRNVKSGMFEWLNYVTNRNQTCYSVG